MLVEILTPDKELYKGEAKLVQLPGKDGSFELLTNHTSMVYTLKKGSIKIIEKDAPTPIFFEINGGILEVSNNKAMILAD